MDNLFDLSTAPVIYEDGVVTIYKISESFGFMVLSGTLTFLDGAMVGNVYKYYGSGFQFKESFDLVKLRNIIIMYTSIPMLMTSSDHHMTANLMYHGIVTPVGPNSSYEWVVSASTFVRLR